MKIEGKRVLVTGASRGLGRALALACLGAGAREVLAGARQLESLENLRETAADVRLTPVRLDVTSEDDVRAAADLGRVDILINNAGGPGVRAGDDCTWRRFDCQRGLHSCQS